MNQWALLKNGRIANVVTTARSQADIQKRHPDFEVANVYTLPPDVQRDYQYWDEDASTGGS